MGPDVWASVTCERVWLHIEGVVLPAQHHGHALCSQFGMQLAFVFMFCVFS